MFSEYNVYIYIYTHTHIIAMVLFFPGFQSIGLGVWVSRQLGKKNQHLQSSGCFGWGGRITRRVHIKAPRGVFFSSGDWRALIPKRRVKSRVR